MKYLFLGGLICWAALGSAQSLDSTKMDVMNVGDLLENKASTEVKIVSASRSKQNINDLPITIHVITREEILQNGYITLVDALKHIAGMRVSQPGTGLEGETFLMRGLVGNYYTKILLNSIPLQPSTSGLLPIAEQLPIAQAERIEIIFGPNSSIYGADAMAGVINIITKMPSNNDTFAQGSSVIGTSGFRYFNFMTGSKFGKDKNTFTYSLYGNYAKREDLNITDDQTLYAPAYSNALLPPIHDLIRTLPKEEVERQMQLFVLKDFPFYQGNSFETEINDRPQNSYLLGFQVNYRNFQFSFNEMYRQNHSGTGLTPLIFSHANPNTFFGDKIQRFTASYNQDFQKWSFTANLSYNRYRMNPKSGRGSNYAGFGGISYKFAASDDLFMEFLARYTSKRKWEWTLGTAFQVSSIFPLTNDLETPFHEPDYQPFTEHTPPPHPVLGLFGYNPKVYHNSSIFAQTFKIKNRWTFMAGIRLDANTGYEAAQNQNFEFLFNSQPRISVQYKIKNDLSVRFSAGTAFKAPAPSEMYVSLGIPTSNNKVNYQQIPNPKLAPEALGSAEIGLRYTPTPNFLLEGIVYFHEIRKKQIADMMRIDTLLYPNYFINSAFPVPMARSYLNDDKSDGAVGSAQILLKYKNISKYKLNLEVFAAYHWGRETLPVSSFRQNDGLKLNDYRMLPNFIGQLNIDATPFKNLYIRIESVLMSSWLPRFVINDVQFDHEEKRVKGYFAMDLLLRHKLGKNFNAHLRVLNVFNTNYGGIDATGFDVDLAYNPQYLRSFQFGINFVLN